MNLIVPKGDGRWCDGCVFEIIDEHALMPDVAREIRFEKPNGRHVSLYGDRYKGTFKTHAEAVAFVAGVQAVLEHMID